MKRELLIEKRKKARYLYNEKGWSKNKIADHLVSHWNSVDRWICMDEDQIDQDGRGWEKGRLRDNTQKQRERIIDIRKQLRKEQCYFFGSEVIQKNYRKQYSDQDVPSLYFIEKTLREENLTVSQENKRVEDGAEYMKYPKDRLDKLGKVVMGIDFVGPRYIEDQTEPVHFLARKYIRPIKYGMMDRVESQTSEEALNVLLEDFKSHPIPDVLRLDNDRAFGVVSTSKRCIGGFLKAVLNLGMTPVFSAFSHPWNNGSTEGFNSLFSRKMWNQLQFSDEEQIDVEIKEFNVAYQKYSDLVTDNPELDSLQERTLGEENPLPEKQRDGLVPDRDPEIYWLRVVKEDPEAKTENRTGVIQILQEEIELPPVYINQFTLSKLDVRKEQLTVRVENEKGHMETIKTVDFKLNNPNYLEEGGEEDA